MPLSAWRVRRVRKRPAPQTLAVPGDKSISHRAAMLAALAQGESEIVNFLPGSDCLATVAALESLGVRVKWLAPDRLAIRGARQFQAPEGPIDCGNSGTGMRLLSGLLAGRGIDVQLHGDASLSARPMRRVVEPLEAHGRTHRSPGRGWPSAFAYRRRRAIARHQLRAPDSQRAGEILRSARRAGRERRNLRAGIHAYP